MNNQGRQRCLTAGCRTSFEVVDGRIADIVGGSGAALAAER
jgi:hypothetical protein